MTIIEAKPVLQAFVLFIECIDEFEALPGRAAGLRFRSSGRSWNEQYEISDDAVAPANVRRRRIIPYSHAA